MLKKINRLQLRGERNFFSQATRLSGSGFTTFIRKQIHPEAQITCIAPKKSTQLAVERNKLKRRARAFCAELLRQNVLAPLEYVLVLQKNFLSQDKTHILRELQDRGNKVYSSTGK